MEDWRTKRVAISTVLTDKPIGSINQPLQLLNDPGMSEDVGDAADANHEGKNNGGKKGVAFEPLLATAISGREEPGYGSTDASDNSTIGTSLLTEDSPSSQWEDRKFFRRSSSLDSSNHRYSLLTENMMTRIRTTADKFQLETVPSEMKNNIKLVTDPNLDKFETGSVYINEASMYIPGAEPEYALTVNTDIYARILNEINDSFDVPCGLYFCCHGGDGAHTGVASHHDHVDIRLAYVFLGLIFGTMMIFEIITPDVDDAFYGD